MASKNENHPYELVRVRDGNVERTTTRAAATKAGLTVLPKPATDARNGGKPLPAKTVTDKAGAPAAAKTKEV
jgi:hypothetical protein